MAGRALEKVAGKEKLRFGSTISIIVAHEELVEFELEHRKFRRDPSEFRRRREIEIRAGLWGRRGRGLVGHIT